jgi:hypothetical protein
MRILHAAYDSHAAVWSACGSIALHVACPITFVSMTQRVLMHAAALVQPSMKSFRAALIGCMASQWLLISNKYKGNKYFRYFSEGAFIK